MPKNNPNETPGDREIVLSRTFDAPRELVWQAMTDPQHLAHWWGPDGFSITTRELELRPGGAWKFIMHGPDGTDYDNQIRYREILKPERLTYTHGSESDPDQFDVVATFTEENKKTTLTLRSIFPTAAARDFVVKQFGALEGGRQTLERLGKYLPTLKATKP